MGNLRKTVSAWTKSYISDSRGNIAMIFGLCGVALVAAGGGALDWSRAMITKSRLGAALDAAALAVGKDTGLTQQQAQVMAQQFFDANYSASNFATPGPVQVSMLTDGVSLSVSAALPTTLLRIVQINSLNLSVANEVRRGSRNIEVALALDNTNSMSGTKIADLKVAAKALVDLVVQNAQTPTYSKVALAPYSTGVNVGAYAAQVRGPINGGKAITNAAWEAAPAKTITGATKTNPVVVTANAHGLSNGDRVFIKNVSGMTQLNNNQYTVAGATANTFQLSGINGTFYNTYTSGGSVTKCTTSSCEVVITAVGHGLSNGNIVYIRNVGGMTQINDQTFTVASATADTYKLSGVTGTGFSAYTSGGDSYCTVAGCEYYRFQNPSGGWRLHRVTTCVSERTTDAYTDAAPGASPLGRNYPAVQVSANYPVSTTNNCIAGQIAPLSSDKVALHAAIDAMTAGNSSGGHVGVAWAWYLLSPTFSSFFPAASVPGPYNNPTYLKVAIIMTDGEYNSMYCNGVIAQDSTSGSGSSNDKINCNAPNGNTYTQAQALCTAMKAAGVIIYTVGFQVVSAPEASQLINNCASDAAHVYLPATGTALNQAFVDIAQEISQLRLSL